MANFQHSLFGCFDNWCVCIVTYFVPCYTAGRVAETVGESCVSCGLIQCVPIANCFCGALIRGKIRNQKNIEGNVIMDNLAFWCCYCCAWAQLAQEVNAMGGSQTMVRE